MSVNQCLSSELTVLSKFQVAAVDRNRLGRFGEPPPTKRGAKRRHQSRAAQALLRSGDISVVAPPVPIPNTEVKRCSPDGSTAKGRARVGRRQNKMPGGSFHRAFISAQVPRAHASSRSRTC